MYTRITMLGNDMLASLKWSGNL